MKQKKINYIKGCKKTLIKRMRVKTKLIRGFVFSIEGLN
jgi:hypothetical protein